MSILIFEIAILIDIGTGTTKRSYLLALIHQTCFIVTETHTIAKSIEKSDDFALILQYIKSIISNILRRARIL